MLIDPGVALGPKRYGLPPHPSEWARLEKLWSEVKRYASKADVLVVTHYHYDHHDPEEIEVYRDKAVYLKHPKENINKSQMGRASYFLRRLKGVAGFVEVADEKEFRLGSTTLRFSPPVCHGTSSRLGYVLEVSISSGAEKMVHTSDVEGPALDEQADFIIEEDPQILILDGPMTYMLGYRYSRRSLEASIDNINRIINNSSIRTAVLDHHLMRDLGYRDRIARVYENAAERDVEVTSAAEYAGREVEMLEARRQELFREAPEDD